MMRRSSLSFALLCVSLGLAGCLGQGTVEPTRFYLLDSLPVGEPTWQGPSIGVGPVALPDYLDRPHLVLRGRSNEIRLADFARWGAPLKDQVPRVLAENLASLLLADRIAVYPWGRSETPDYQVVVDVLRFDGEDGRDATLNARWALLAKEGKALRSKRSAFTEKTGAKGYEGLAAAESRMLQSLSREIAAAIREEARAGGGGSPNRTASPIQPSALIPVPGPKP